MIVIQKMILDLMWRSSILPLASQNILRDFCQECGALCTRGEQDYQHIYLPIASVGKQSIMWFPVRTLLTLGIIDLLLTISAWPIPSESNVLVNQFC